MLTCRRVATGRRGSRGIFDSRERRGRHVPRLHGARADAAQRGRRLARSRRWALRRWVEIRLFSGRYHRTTTNAADRQETVTSVPINIRRAAMLYPWRPSSNYSFSPSCSATRLGGRQAFVAAAGSRKTRPRSWPFLSPVVIARQGVTVWRYAYVKADGGGQRGICPGARARRRARRDQADVGNLAQTRSHMFMGLFGADIGISLTDASKAELVAAAAGPLGLAECRWAATTPPAGRARQRRGSGYCQIIRLRRRAAAERSKEAAV